LSDSKRSVTPCLFLINASEYFLFFSDIGTDESGTNIYHWPLKYTIYGRVKNSNDLAEITYIIALGLSRFCIRLLDAYWYFFEVKESSLSCSGLKIVVNFCG